MGQINLAMDLEAGNCAGSGGGATPAIDSIVPNNGDVDTPYAGTVTVSGFPASWTLVDVRYGGTSHATSDPFPVSNKTSRQRST